MVVRSSTRSHFSSRSHLGYRIQTCMAERQRSCVIFSIRDLKRPALSVGLARCACIVSERSRSALGIRAVDHIVVIDILDLKSECRRVVITVFHHGCSTEDFFYRSQSSLRVRGKGKERRRVILPPPQPCHHVFFSGAKRREVARFWRGWTCRRVESPLANCTESCRVHRGPYGLTMCLLLAPATGTCGF